MNLTQCIKGGSVDGRSGWIVGFHYDEQTVEDLKAMVPHTLREWREDNRVWWISEECELALNRLFKNFDALAHLQGRLL